MLNWYKKSLARRVTLIIFFCFLFTFTGVIGISSFLQQRQIRSIELKLARQIGNALIRNFKDFMPGCQHKDMQDLINGFSKIGLINRIHIIDENGIIKKTNQPERKGTKSAALNLEAALKEGREVVEKEYKEKEGLWLYTLILPVKNETSCYSCHTQDKKILGALRLGIYLWSFKKQALTLVGVNILIILIGIILTFILIRLFLRRFIIRPLEALLETTQQIADGNLECRLSVYSEDEIGKLSCNFNILTEKLKLSMDEVIQSTKMKTLGLLSGALFHDLIGSIAGIGGYAQFILEDLEKHKSEAVDFLKLKNQIACIGEAAANCKRIIESYYIFSGKASQKIGEVDIKKLLEEVLIVLGKNLKAMGIQAKLKTQALPLISGNSSQLLQAFTNIILNSQEAMPNGGSLDIGAVFNNDEFGKRIAVSIADTGSGISSGDLRKISDPFFTTKQERGNVGLGLFTVKQIIEAHKGRLKIESKPGEGTKVVVELLLDKTL